MTKAITFLGNVLKTGERPFGYAMTPYSHKTEICKTPFVAEAIVTFFQPMELYILTTQEGYDNHFQDIVHRLKGRIEPKYIPIPAPQSDMDVWSVFDAITDIIQPHDTIIFDVTLSFRSIPILALIASAYVQSVRGATIQALTYAEFVPGAQGTPIRDMSGFLGLLNWTTATDAFVKYGRADDLVALAGNTALATHLGDLTAALQTSRPQQTMKEAYALKDALQRAADTSDNIAKPLQLLAERIANEYVKLGHADPNNQHYAREVVEKQLDIIEWYLAKGMAVQAITAAREWLVSLVLMHVGEDLFNKGNRQHAEYLIRDDKNRDGSPRTRFNPALVLHLDALRKVWQQITPARNSIAHTTDKLTAKEVQRDAGKLYELLQPLLS